MTFIMRFELLRRIPDDVCIDRAERNVSVHRAVGAWWATKAEVVVSA
jgi:hypothetical protein